MNQVKMQLSHPYSVVGNKLNLFLILALAPLALIFYFNPLSAVIPFYGFLLLLIKGQKLLNFKEAKTIQKILGLSILVGSFFAYFIVAQVYSEVAFYTSANYVAYILGLFLIFFDSRALREAISPLFLITAATSSALISQISKPFLSPYANDMGHIVASILRLLGINASVQSRSGTPIISFPSSSGTIVSGAFVYECMGVSSALVFSIILVVILLEDPSSLKVKTAASIVGLIGTFILNLARVTIIFVTDYFYGVEVGATIHYVIGYALFSIWLVVFLYAYSKRQTLHAVFMSISRRIT